MREIDPAENYEDTARAWANHLDKPFPYVDSHEVYLCIGLMRAIWHDITEETIESIESNPVLFADRVAAYRHHKEAEKCE